jgi:hypothetical protein
VQAHASGWETTRLFGVSPTLGTIGVDRTDHLLPLVADVTEFALHPKDYALRPKWHNRMGQ